MNRFTNVELTDIHFIYGPDALLLGCIGKDIQRGANQIIECSLGYIRGAWIHYSHDARYWEGSGTKTPLPEFERLSLRLERLDQLFIALD